MYVCHRLRYAACLAASACALASAGPARVAGQGAEEVKAIVGATVIDGNGGQPLADATIVIRGKKIEAIGPRASIEVPRGATVIDGRGKYATPGFVDTNVHMSLAFGRRWTETNARYWDRNADLVEQGVQLHLKHGVTTVRDSYGALLPMMRVRDAIERGETVGPRMYVAGNIVGWGGPFSMTFSRIPERDLTLFEEQINDSIALGSGEELSHMTPEEVRVAINKYLDLGPDFIKYGGTSHQGYPGLIGFSPEAQRVIVEETHKRGLVAETHSTTLEGLHLSIEAGVDLIQHPEVLGNREITDELVRMIVDRKVVCSIISNAITGRAWEWQMEQREAARKRLAASDKSRRVPLTTAEIRRRVQETGVPHPGSVLKGGLETRRHNAEKLIAAGCITTVGTDNLLFGYQGVAPEFLREEHPIVEHQNPGIGTIIGIEGLVELGMTPAQAIVAATKNGAIANKALDEYGTLEAGKLADILLLDGDPLTDIRNIRRLGLVMKEGVVVDVARLPAKIVTGDWRKVS
jgi:imidazolonepropionase-like amidohydrolase